MSDKLQNATMLMPPDSATAGPSHAQPPQRHPDGRSAETGSDASSNERHLGSRLQGTQKRLFRESVWVVGGRLLGIGTAIAINVVLARVLPPADVGVFFLLASILTFAGFMAMFGLNAGMVRFVSERIGLNDVAGAQAVLRQGTKVAVASILTGSLICWGFLHFAGEQVFGVTNLAVLAPLVALSVLGSATIQLAASLLRSFHDSRLSILLTGQFGGPLCNLLFIGSTVAVSRWIVPSLEQVMVFCTISLCLLIPVAIISVQKIARSRLAEIEPSSTPSSLLPMSTLLIVCLPLMLTQGLSYITGQADIWIGGAIVDHEQLALYAAARRLMLLIGMPMQLVNLTVIASIAELRAQGRLQDLQRILRSAATFAAVVAIAVCIPIMIFPAQIAAFIFGPFYADGAMVLRILCIGQLVFVCVGAAELTLMMSGQHMKALSINIFTSISLFISGVLMTQQWGIVGLAIAWTSIVSLQCIGFCLSARWSVGVWTVMDVRVLRTGREILAAVRAKFKKANNIGSLE
ncbi:Polysaccharide biosynthesis protein [Rosistilla carotiformis]|uniref:Polysaccharide biosynthesis protein n=1 Tax=Rosistilla carotiformis TaxID=2528017 RepID=A0A518K201_9BACT|nr:oligosaccharide flippase family protein [Rosistilla carotiformis]QDV71802.1 Polysaccharide biosynthesis protein [Rosistilla carotiformis]